MDYNKYMIYVNDICDIESAVFLKSLILKYGIATVVPKTDLSFLKDR